MPIGDGTDATEAGMAVVLDGADRREGAEELTKTRDYLANGPTYWKPGVRVGIEDGGTGESTASGARAALGIPPFADPGTLTPGAVPVYDGAGRMVTNTPANPGEVANKAYVDSVVDSGDYLPLTGGVVSGDIGATGTIEANGRMRSSGSRSTTVTTSYVALYADGSGWFGPSPSAAKYKHAIEDYDGSALGLRPVTYILNDDENETVRLGVVADEANEIEPLLVVHENGEVESFKYELLAVALLRDVQRLAAEVAELKAAA